MGYWMLKPSLYKNNGGSIKTKAGEDDKEGLCLYQGY